MDAKSKIAGGGLVMDTNTNTANKDSVTVEEHVFTEKHHVQFVQDMADAGYDVFAYSGRGMYGKHCPAVRCGRDDAPSEHEVYRATEVKLSRDSLGRGTVLYAR